MSSNDRASQASKLIAELRALLPPIIDGSGSADPSVGLPFKLFSLRETLLFRAADLSDAALSLIPDHGLGAAILARSVMETTALLVALYDLVAKVNSTGNANGFDESITKLLLGSRRKGASIEATSILSHIDRMDKRYKTRLGKNHEGHLRSMYDDLCELAHPNAPGVIASYGAFNRATSSLALAKQDPKELGRIAATVLCLCLGISKSVRSEIENSFYDFKNICRGL